MRLLIRRSKFFSLLFHSNLRALLLAGCSSAEYLQVRNLKLIKIFIKLMPAPFIRNGRKLVYDEPPNPSSSYLNPHNPTLLFFRFLLNPTFFNSLDSIATTSDFS